MRVVLISSLAICLIACSSGATPVQVDNIVVAEDSWQALGRASHAKHLTAIESDKQAPVAHSQLARAVAGVVDQCARRARSGRSWQTSQAMAADFSRQEIECVQELVNQTLVVSGADRAYEASFAARSSDPRWFQPVLPSHILVD